MLCRFTGHVRHFYSVGQHSWLGSYIVPEANALEFLLHDAAEAYLGDMNRPLKHLTEAGPAYREIEYNIMRVIREKFGLPQFQSKIIHQADNEMLYAEKAQLMSPLVWSQASREGCECQDMTAAKVTIREMTPREVEEVFLERFNYLRGVQI
jgi:5'-deoxynucleotidase YfbR-like HD superfamily hydrolase